MSLPKLLWHPSPNFSKRSARVDLLVLHDTEGSYAGSVSWFAQKVSNVSAHFVIKEDGSEVTQMVDIADKAWHACAFNSRSIGFEMAGIAAKGFSEPEWLAVAEILAFHLYHLQIPCKWARGGVGPGFTSHYDLGAAGGGHRDPTTDPAKWAYLVSLVEAAYNRGNFPALWEREHQAGKCAMASPEPAKAPPTVLGPAADPAAVVFGPAIAHGPVVPATTGPEGDWLKSLQTLVKTAEPKTTVMKCG